MLTPKFIRAHSIPSTTNGFAWFFRLVYEFWGFCVNGSNDLVNAQCIPSGGIQMPTGFTTVGLIQSGSDGFTAAGMPFFNTVGTGTFSPSDVNLWLVTWVSGSTCTDDSIYQITQWENSSSVRVNVMNGGTPYTGTLHPSFTARSDINYRLVDFSQASTALTYLPSASLVLQFNDAVLVNSGQATSQAQLMMISGSSPADDKNLGITLSPSGSWQQISGTYQFTDPTTQLNGPTVGEGFWFFSADSPAYISLWAAGDFIIAHYKSTTNNGASAFHIEIPQRLYPQGDDPNPIVMINQSDFGIPSLNSNTAWYGGGCYMHHPPLGTTIPWSGLSRSQWGDRFVSGAEQSLQSVVNGRYNGAVFNTFQNKFVFSDLTLGLFNVIGQYCLARVRLRHVRVIPPIIPQFQRVGNLGEWIHVGNGVMWPWDNTLLPYNLFLGGN